MRCYSHSKLNYMSLSFQQKMNYQRVEEDFRVIFHHCHIFIFIQGGNALSSWAIWLSITDFGQPSPQGPNCDTFIQRQKWVCIRRLQKNGIALLCNMNLRTIAAVWVNLASEHWKLPAATDSQYTLITVNIHLIQDDNKSWFAVHINITLPSFASYRKYTVLISCHMSNLFCEVRQKWHQVF